LNDVPFYLDFENVYIYLCLYFILDHHGDHNPNPNLHTRQHHAEVDLALPRKKNKDNNLDEDNNHENTNVNLSNIIFNSDPDILIACNIDLHWLYHQEYDDLNQNVQIDSFVRFRFDEDNNNDKYFLHADIVCDFYVLNFRTSLFFFRDGDAQYVQQHPDLNIHHYLRFLFDRNRRNHNHDDYTDPHLYICLYILLVDESRELNFRINLNNFLDLVLLPYNNWIPHRFLFDNDRYLFFFPEQNIETNSNCHFCQYFYMYRNQDRYANPPILFRVCDREGFPLCPIIFDDDETIFIHFLFSKISSLIYLMITERNPNNRSSTILYDLWHKIRNKKMKKRNKSNIYI